MCWLCSYQGDSLGKQLNDFIVKNIGFMDMNCISLQVSDYLLLQHPDAQGASKEDVFGHIQAHVLHPKVRMAGSIAVFVLMRARISIGKDVCVGGVDSAA